MKQEYINDREIKSIIEGLLFVWADSLSVTDLGQILEIPNDRLLNILHDMQAEMEHERRGLVLEFLEDSVQLMTRKDHAPYFAKLIKKKKPGNLSNSALECLAIIAYRQPVTRIDIDEIRGVQSSGVIDTLLARGLIEEAGRLDRIGRPILYKTSQEFLRAFDLNSLDQLPGKELLENFSEENEEMTGGEEINED